MKTLWKKCVAGMMLAIMMITIVPTSNMVEAANKIVTDSSKEKTEEDNIKTLYLPVGEKHSLVTKVKLGDSWTSSNEKVATVDKRGVVTGVTKGTATITYSSNNKVKNTIKVIVGKFITVGTDKNKTMTETQLKIDEVLDLNFYGLLVQQSNLIYHWTVSGDAVTVDDNGIVTAKKLGTAKILLSVENEKEGILYHAPAVTIKVTKTGATTIPTVTSTPKVTSTPTPTLAPSISKDVKVGDTVFFGTYEQDNKLANGKEVLNGLYLM